MNENAKRLMAFRRNPLLEQTLEELNVFLVLGERQAIQHFKEPQYPIIFVVGPMKSGSTVFMQWISSLGIIAYPTNLLSRFYGAPYIGAKIQLMLTDDRYNFRNELGEFRVPTDFISENGKTTGVLAPNEFWYFWRRFIKYGELDYLSDEELERTVDTTTLAAELAALTHAFAKPFALKAMILQQNIPFLHKLIAKSIFIQLKREPVFNIQSVLRARERQFGDIREWYSFRIKEYHRLQAYDPITQVAGQVYYINKAVDEGLREIEDHRKLVVAYEDFCQRPACYYEQLLALLNRQGCSIDTPYCGVPQFTISNRIDDNREFDAIQAAYQQFCLKML